MPKPIQQCNKRSKLVQHAKTELKKLVLAHDDEISSWMYADVLDVIKLIDLQGHTESSLEYINNTVSKLLRFESLDSFKPNRQIPSNDTGEYAIDWTEKYNSM